jgi:hypothetical protein
MKTCICLICHKVNSTWISFLENFNNYNVYVIVDSPCEILFHPKIKFIQIKNETCKKNGYTNLNLIINSCNGWDKAIYASHTILNEYDYIWFIEDDVFFYNEQALLEMDTRYASIDLLSNEINEGTDLSSWHWSWIKPINYELPYYYGMMCICRMSRKLLNEICNYITSNNEMFFLEAMFPTICKKNNLKSDCPDEFKNVEWRKHFNKNDLKSNYFYHPLKNKRLHGVYRHFIRSKNI